MSKDKNRMLIINEVLNEIKSKVKEDEEMTDFIVVFSLKNSTNRSYGTTTVKFY